MTRRIALALPMINGLAVGGVSDVETWLAVAVESPDQVPIAGNLVASTASTKPLEERTTATAIASRPLGSADRTTDTKSVPGGTWTLSTTGAPVLKSACSCRFERATTKDDTANARRQTAVAGTRARRARPG